VEIHHPPSSGSSTGATHEARTAPEPAVPLDLLGLMVDRAARHGDGEYLRHARSARSVTFTALLESALRWGRWLDNQQVGLADRVGIMVADPVDFAVVLLAVMASGRWATPLDPTMPGRSTVSAIEQLQPALVVSDRPAVSASGPRWVELTAGDHDPLAFSRGGTRDRMGPGGTGGGSVLASSGSTGQPKIVPLHQRQMLHVASGVAGHLRLTEGDTGFNPLPLFHVNAEVVGLLSTLVAGGRLVLDDRFHRSHFWELMGEHRVTWINAVPAIIGRLAELDPDEVVPDRVRLIRSASAPLPVATLHRFEETTGIPVIETYGMTEAASQITANPLVGVRKPGSVGLPVGIDLRIAEPSPYRAGEEGEPVMAGQVQIRGTAVVPPATGTPATEADGGAGPWLSTGDLGYLDQDGYLYLIGRTDHVINRGGEKMFPREIEEVILEDPSVIDAVVIAREDDTLGQVPVAFLVLRGTLDHGAETEDAAVVADRVHRHLHAALPHSKRPVALHVVTRLPSTPTGKVIRRSVHIESPDHVLTLSRP
jgi:acyl-CoA synthetase (AMP-forming)/AMP-acid ligase II